MERDRGARMSIAREHLHTFYSAELADVGESVRLSADAAHHARVKRVEAGERVGLTNGAGQWATGIVALIERGVLDVRVETLGSRAGPPALHLYVPVADRDRMLWLAEKVTEIGVTAWHPVRFRRSASVSPRGEGDAFHAKIQARMVGALEQSNGAWLPRIEPDVSVDDVVVPESGQKIVLDVGGDPLLDVATWPGERAAVHLLVGPEGGIEPAEVEQLMGRGWLRARLGGNMLRFETAALAAVAILQLGPAAGAQSHG